MAEFVLTSPEGEKFKVTAPDDATDEQVMQFFQQNYQTPKKGFVQSAIDTGVQNVKNTINTLTDPETYKQIGHDLTNWPTPTPENRQQIRDAAFEVALSANPITPLSAATRAAVLKAPQAVTDMQKLVSEGVRPTIGQSLGSTAKRTEEALTSVPIAGDMIKGAQVRAMEDFNKAAINRTISPIGESVPKNIPAGYRAVDYAHSKLSNYYDDLLPKLKGSLDSDLSQSITSVVTDYSKSLPAAQAKQLGNIIEENVLKKFDAQGNITGPELKDALSRVGKLVRRFGKSENPDHQLMSEALSEVRQSVNGMLQKANPQYANDLKNVDLGYANLIRVEKAASSVGAKNGVFTPNLLASAVKSADQSLRSSSYARGSALMQDLSQAGQNILGQSLPDSGTALRIAPLLIAGGAGYAGHEGYISPETAAAIMGISAAYTPWGQATLRGAMSGIRNPTLGRSLLAYTAQK